jgi:hypothetical protein
MDAVIDTSKSLSWCTSRRCRGSVTDIAQYLAERLADVAVVNSTAGRLTVTPGSANGVAIVGPVRTYRGKLAFGRWRLPARVTLEVEPWSRTESELLVRPTRRPPLAENAYFTTALAVLESLAAELDANLTMTSEFAHPLRRAS